MNRKLEQSIHISLQSMTTMTKMINNQEINGALLLWNIGEPVCYKFPLTNWVTSILLR